MRVLTALTAWLMTAHVSYAQAKGMYSSNPFTGGFGAKGPHYNPLSGIYRPEVYYNPWTGKDVVNKDYYNAYTGGSAGAKSPSNPYTGSKGSYARPKGMYSANSFTGGVGTKGPRYNPMRGIYRPGVYYNPWTGKDVVNKDYYNAYTGGSAGAKSPSNPYTGNYADGSKGW